LSLDQKGVSRKSRKETAAEKFLEGYNCAQSVLYSFCDDLHFEKNTALKIACGFGVGMGLKGKVCGAVTGGIMVMGIKFGRGEKGEPTAMYLTYTKTRELMSQFTDKHGTFICRNLIHGLELTTEEGQKQFMEKDLLNKSCILYVQSVVEILENLI
jgi:C_GCAxxG_C_C family probable redox protein